MRFTHPIIHNGNVFTLHSCHMSGEYKACAYRAHADLKGFFELGNLFDFDTWLEPMSNRLEEGISAHNVIQFERVGDEIFLRSKENMGLDIPLSARRLCWPVPQHARYPRKNPRPRLPVVNSPSVLPLQPWKDYRQVRRSLLKFYSDPSWGTPPAQRHQMNSLLSRWGLTPHEARGWPQPSWPERWQVTGS